MKINPLKLFILLIFILPACARGPQSTADIPRLLPSGYQVAVAPFTQPLHPGQMISGQIPEAQGKIPGDALLGLDLELREVLRSATKRKYEFLKGEEILKSWNETHNTSQPGGLDFWIDQGKISDAQYILVPQVIDWHEREGSEAGVTNSAHVRVEFYLLNVKNGILVSRSIFEEKQVGLIDNLLGVPEFFKRGGKWVSATQLTRDGMEKAVREIGL